MIDRRSLMKLGAAAPFAAMLPKAGLAAFQPQPSGWRLFELTTRVDLPADGKPAQAWVPVPSVHEDGWMKPQAVEWTTNADRAEIVTDGPSGAQYLHAEWSGVETATLNIVARVETQDRAKNLSAPTSDASLSAEERALYTAATELLPTDGIVKETADMITQYADTDLRKARAIYEWIVENTARNPDTPGCGLGDIASMLEVGDLTGKCADLNALYVGLARAAGLPARDVYGLRVAPSAFGYKSLGAGSEDVTKAQHCRAEVFVDGYGWIPADPADVRKVMLQEGEGNLPLDHPLVEDARAGLFGSWEGNWIGYNFAHDVVLPGAENATVPFLMYPQAEIDGKPRDELDPATFAYAITAVELTR